MPRFRLAPSLLLGLLLSSHSFAAPLTMGMVGDSLTDDYLGGPKPANNDLAAYSWGQVLAALRPGELDFGAYKPMDDLWDDKIRYSGYEHNWATSGGVASNNTKLFAMGLQLSVTVFGASYLSSQTAGLVQQIKNGDISTTYVGIGTNDFFYRTTNFDSSGNMTPSTRPIDDAFVNDIASSILTNVDALRNAGTSSGHPVDIVLGLLPAGTAGGSSIPILDGINAVNQQLVDGAATRDIPTVDLFAWALDPTRVDSDGTVHVGQLAIGIDGTASDIDIGPDGKGPCDSTGCALRSHANYFRADDGLHPNTVIQALIANEILKKLNSHYGHDIPLITDAEILTLVGVPLPTACQEDLDKDGKGFGNYSFVEGSCPTKTVAIPLVTNTLRLGATPHEDNCPWAANGKQLDSDANGIGDACEGDYDSDKISDEVDNCPVLPNANQLNNDGDDEGDACDEDDDNDVIPDVIDNCPFLTSLNLTDTDGDGDGNACDDDDDNDGVADASDAFPLDATESVDTDSDGIGNNADSDDDNDSVADTSDAFPLDTTESADTDSDGIGDNNDNCWLVSNADQADTDLDNLGDACDLYLTDPQLFLESDGTSKNGNAGTSIAMADMDNDGMVDLLVGSPSVAVKSDTKSLKKAGVITIISGTNGAPLRTLSGTAANQRFGTAIAVVNDQNSDGIRDLVVGEPLADPAKRKDAGRVALYSGSDGAFLQEIGTGTKAGDHFGAAVAIGDVNDDEVDDLIVGAPLSDVGAKNAGSVLVYKGLTTTPLYARHGSQAGEYFGSAVAVNDNKLFVGSPLFDLEKPDSGKLKDAGSVFIFDCNEGSSAALLTVSGSGSKDRFGSSVTATNMAEEDSWAVGVPMADLPAAKDAGTVQIFSGLDSTPVRDLPGSNAGDNQGSAVSMQGDLNRDGIPDIAVGTAKRDIGSGTSPLKDAGGVKVFSGKAP